MAASPQHLDVAVVGGGIAGLAAAYFLKDEAEVAVFEASAHPGGRCQSGRRGGWHYAKGTEYLGPPDGALERIVDGLGLHPVEIPSPMDVHFYGGRFHVGAQGYARLLVERGGVAAFNRLVRALGRAAGAYEDAYEFDAGSPLARLDDITLAEWFDELALPEIYRDRFNVASRGLFGAAIQEISALSAVPELGFDFLEAEEIENLEDLEGEDEKDGSGAYSFVTGISTVTDALARVLGERLLLGARVTEVRREGGRYLISGQSAEGESAMVSADGVIFAAPAPITLDIAGAVLSDEQRHILDRIPYSTFATVALFSESPIFDQAFDLAVPDGWIFTDIYDSNWVQRAYDDRAAGFAGHVAAAYLAPPGYRDRELMRRSDADLVAATVSDLQRIFPAAPALVSGSEVTRHAYAYPVMRPGAYRRLARLHRTMIGSRVQLAGDGVIYPTFEAAADSAALAAERIYEALNG